ncbi:MAG: HD domain-containing protein [Candidatus Micrarchaeota archaeon]
MKIIRDAIHEDIELNDLEIALVDTPEMQRLRLIKQLSLAYLVYPSAHHTRFEHSLGTFHLTKMLSDRLIKEEGERQKLRISALLHDVGHFAFSHLPEGLIMRETGKDHEQIGAQKILSGEIAAVLERHGISPKDVLKAYKGAGGKIISSDLGTDRMDYLLRDAYFTGVGYSIIDAQRLLLSLSFKAGRLVLQEKGLLAAESLLVSRYLMFNAVYNHHAVRIATSMLEKALDLSLQDGRLSIQELINGTDEAVLLGLKDEPLISMIQRRKLYKVAYESQSFSFKGTEESAKKRIEDALSEELPFSDFIVSMPKQHMGTIGLEVLRADGSIIPLPSESILAGAVSRERKASGLIIATSPKDAGKAAGICRSFH